MIISNFQFPIFKPGIVSVVLLLTAIPVACQAFSFEGFFGEIEKWFSTATSSNAQVINKINVSANTGGNIVDGNGEIKEGEQKSRIYVQNIINGKEIEPIDIETEAGRVKVKSEIKTEDGKAVVQREIEIDSEKSNESYEIGLGDNGNIENDQVPARTLKNTQGWWPNFIENLKSFFRNIFNF